MRWSIYSRGAPQLGTVDAASEAEAKAQWLAEHPDCSPTIEAVRQPELPAPPAEPGPESTDWLLDRLARLNAAASAGRRHGKN